jgi:mannose-6-phosphate isomerase
MKPGVTRQKFEAALNNKRLEQDVLAAVPAKTGRTVFVPGGRLHAIGAGCLLLEVQQNSNTTYRVYDWDRVGADGKPRELHLEKALQVIDWDHPMPEVVPPKLIESDHLNQHWQILDSPFFKLQRFDLSEPRDINHDGASFQILFVLRGTTLIGANGIMAACAPGTSCLIPAAAHDYTITPIKGSASIMLITM